MSSSWSHGDLVARREELGLQPDAVAERTPMVGVWLETPVFIVEDTPEHLVSYIAPGAQFRFPEGPWPTPNGQHPWLDLELDILVFPDGSHIMKDDELLDDRVAEGRYSAELVDWIRTFGDQLTGRLASEGPWWDRSWAQWMPPEHWVNPELPAI